MARRRDDLRTGCDGDRDDPARPARARRGRGAGRARGAALGAAVARARAWRQFERAFAERLGAPAASAVSSGTAGLHLALRAGRRRGRRRGHHEPVLVRGLGQRGALRAGPAGVRRHRPGDAEPRPRGRRGGGDARARARCCPCTSSAIPPTCRPSRHSRAEHGLGIVEDACEALGGRHADGTRGRRPRQPGGVRASTPTSSSRPARAGW